MKILKIIHAIALAGCFFPLFSVASETRCILVGSPGNLFGEVLPVNTMVPYDSPEGVVIYRSPAPIVREIECYRIGTARGEEDIVFSINPRNRLTGRGISVGVELQGTRYSQKDGSSIVSSGYSLPACPAGSISSCPRVRFTVTAHLIIERYGTVPGVGPIGLTDPFAEIVHIGSRDHVDLVADAKYAVAGLNNIVYMGCSADIEVAPAVLDFGSLNFGNASADAIAARRDFTVHASRSCDFPMQLTAQLVPITGTSVGDTLIPLGNDSVGLTIINRATSAIQPLRTDFPLVDLRSVASGSKDFSAELTWRTSTPVPGPFNGSILINVTYR